jgi:UDP-2,4-diacetamido-2,4,6-trideoxy-beta-L-altropyranose hydrolase
MQAGRKKILLRADGNGKSGLGHMYRILALAEAFSPENECVIASRASSSTEVLGNRYPVVIVPDLGRDEEAGWLAKNYPSNEWAMVADGYEFAGPYQKSIKEKGYYFIYVDDLISGHYFADVIINHSLAARYTAYHAEPATRFALGTEYAIVRKRFLSQSSGQRSSSERSVAFVCFGGADPNNLSAKAGAALSELNSISTVHIVAGAAFSKESLNTISTISPKIKVHVNLQEKALSDLMAESHFAVSSASTVLYELCGLKVPTLAGYYVSNQTGLYEGFINAKAIAGAGDISAFSKNDFSKTLESFLDEPSWDHYLNAQDKLFDGKSPERLLQLLSPVNYRPAVEGDVKLVFEWSNDKVTRANSYSSEPIQFDSHKQWFEGKIADPNSVLIIAEYQGVPAGLIRYDIHESHAVAGILVDKQFRGLGLSTVFLRDTGRTFLTTRKKPIYAYIKKGNMPSVKAFEKAGYKLAEEKVVQGAASYIYKITEQDV